MSTESQAQAGTRSGADTAASADADWGSEEQVARRLERRLATERNVWVASARPDGSPHVTPVWFVWDGRAFWMCTSTGNVKARNLRRDPRLSLALEDGDRPVVVEGEAVLHERPFPPAIVAAFRSKFEWDITYSDAPEGDYGLLLEVVPRRWLLRST